MVIFLCGQLLVPGESHRLSVAHNIDISLENRHHCLDVLLPNIQCKSKTPLNRKTTGHDRSDITKDGNSVLTTKALHNRYISI